MEILLALGAAVSYGASDFTGGLLTRTASVLIVVFVSQVASLAGLVAVAPFLQAKLSVEAIGWGAAAGVAGVVGTSALYRGLAVGRMSVVAPISGVLAAGIPVAVGLVLGERPWRLALVGVGVGLVAVVAVSRTVDPAARAGSARLAKQSGTLAGRSGRGVAEGLGAGIGFGLFFVLLERSPADSGLWPLVGMRMSMIVLVGSVVAVGGLSHGPSGGMVLRLAGLGLVNVWPTCCTSWRHARDCCPSSPWSPRCIRPSR